MRYQIYEYEPSRIVLLESHVDLTAALDRVRALLAENVRDQIDGATGPRYFAVLPSTVD